MNFTDIMSLVESGTISFDDVKEYNKNVHMIAEAYVRGDITHEQKEELMLENRRVYFGDLFEEKASHVEYTMRQFKKKYHYDPQKKTIIVNGETYKCDLDLKSNTIGIKNPMTGKTEYYVRQTGASLGDPEKTIILDKEFFELKNNKRRDAMLQHEVGHLKLHSVSGNYDIFVDKMTDNVIRQKGDPKTYGKTRADIRSEIVKRLEDNGISKNNFNEISDTKIKNLRSSIIKDLEKKFIGNSHNKTDHLDAHEIEADRYAINKSSKNQLKKGIRELHKKYSSDKTIRREIDGMNDATRKNLNMSKSEFDQSDDKYTKSKDTINDIRKVQQKMQTDDYNQRARAMDNSGIEKDPEKNKIYQ